MAFRQSYTPSELYPQGARMSLTVAAIQAAKPREKPYKLFGQGGLFLWCIPTAGATGATNTECTVERSC